MTQQVSTYTAQDIGNRLQLDWSKYSLKEFTDGMNVELEHKDVTHGDLMLTGKIAKAHLDEMPNYYTRLKKMETRRPNMPETAIAAPGRQDKPKFYTPDGRTDWEAVKAYANEWGWNYTPLEIPRSKAPTEKMAEDTCRVWHPHIVPIETHLAGWGMYDAYYVIFSAQGDND